ncbi:MAG: DedA family protein [Pseudohongiellaceae bacterium]
MFAFAEACVGIGLFISGVFLVAIATFVLEYQLASVQWICTLAFAGAMAGDHFGFYLGQFIGPGFHQTRLALKYSSSIEKGEKLILKFGSAAIFIGRFIPAIRSLVPALMGISGFTRTRYSLFDALACVFWASALGAIVLGIETIL